MSHIKQVIHGIVAGVKEDIAHFQQYLLLLQKQQQLMQQYDNQQLLQLNRQHERYHQALLKQAKQRKKHLISLGLSGDEKGMESIINALSQKPAAQVRALWQQLQSLMQQCKQQNDINGEILASQQQLIGKLINPSKPDEYSPR